MQKEIKIKVDPQTASDPVLLKDDLRAQLNLKEGQTLGYRVLKRSIDARGRKIKINLTVLTSTDEELNKEKIIIHYPDVSRAKRCCHIIGCGPAGLFAALRCLELGIRPVIFERGKDVKSRRRDLAAINKLGLVNPESNYCFGEGGAGTYSDGKLYTRSGKRGDTEKILRTLVFHGATEEVLVDMHPHIGTNKLPQLIENIRGSILEHGGEIHFNCKLSDIKIKDRHIEEITVSREGGKENIKVDSLILATGHSARDIYLLLRNLGISIESKPFALGVRAEHPQELIDTIQYHCHSRHEVDSIRKFLPAASYSLVHQAGDRGVYSFCMCPGGIIAPCATSQEEVVTNGWSPSKRNNPFANSGVVVELRTQDFSKFNSEGALSGMAFQADNERRAWEAGGKTQAAPAQRINDFIKGKISASLPGCSYQPGIVSADLCDVLDPVVSNALRVGLKAFGSKMKGYLDNEAVLVAVESRTSTPVRIPRDKDKLSHPQLENLFPCGEGAGYAGGIMSAAIDGERCAAMVAK